MGSIALVNNGKTSYAVALAVLAGMALALGVVYYCGEKLGEGLQGPSKIGRAADGSIWVASHGRLHRFTPSGERREVVALSELGRGAVISELLALSDGSVVLAEAEPSAAYRCDIVAKRCTSFTGRIAEAIGPTRHALMIAADEPAGRFYVSDNANHRLILLDFEGKVLDVTAPRRLVYPNELTLTQAGEIVAVDTNHHRLVRLSVQGDRFGHDLWEMRTDRGAPHRPGRIWPMDFVRMPSGEWWVLNARDGMKDADLLVFAADGRPLRRVELGASSDPTQIAAVAGGVLVAEPGRMKLSYVMPGGTLAEAWGGAAFNAELAELSSSRIRWSALRLMAQILMVGLPLAGVFVLWRMGERLPNRPVMPIDAAEPALVGGGIYWLAVRPRFVRNARRLMLATTALVLVLVAAIVALMPGVLQAVPPGHAAGAIALLVVVLLAPLPFVLRTPPAWRQRLGTDGERFFYDPGNGRVEEYPFTELATVNGKQVLAGKRLLALYSPMGAVFDEGDFRNYILARLPQSARINEAQLFLRYLKAIAASWRR